MISSVHIIMDNTHADAVSQSQEGDIIVLRRDYLDDNLV